MGAQNSKDNAEMQDNAQKFFGCTGGDMAVRAELMEANRPVDPKSTVKNMFVMNASGAAPPLNKYVGSKDFQTSNGFYHGLTKESSDQLRHTDLSSPPRHGKAEETFQVCIPPKYLQT